MRDALPREVRRLALPAILHQLLQTLVFVVDRAMLGHHAESSLAAMQIAGPLEWSVWSVFSAFTVGTIARVGRHVGAHRYDEARRAAWVSLGFAVLAGVLLASAAPLLLDRLAWAYPKASPVAIAEARAYLAWTLSASPVVFVATAAIAVQQASGDTRTPLAIGVVANAIHIALNRVLILGALGIPAMGARGAGLSTAVTFSLVAVLAMAALSRRGRAVSLRRAETHGESARGAYAREAREVLSVALPSLAERVLYHAGYVGFVLIITQLGDVPMAANQALISVESISFLSADGFGVAAAALVAQKLGAGRVEEAVRVTKISVVDAIVLLSVVGVVFLATRSVILPIFTPEADVIAAGAAAVPVLAFAQPFMATSVVVAEALRGGGFTRTVLCVSALSAFVVRLSCTWLFAITLGLGLTGVWMGSTADWLVRTALLVSLGTARARSLRRAV
jgi:putative MATE family efflux protein